VILNFNKTGLESLRGMGADAFDGLHQGRTAVGREISVTEKRKLAVGMLLFPGMTQLDLTGPYEVFCRMPNTSVSLLSATPEPVRSEWGLTITPDRVFADSEAQDILCSRWLGGERAVGE